MSGKHMSVASQRGFTLVELLLSVAIMGVLAGVSLPVYQSFQARTELDVAAEQVAHALRRAEAYARGMRHDDAWSVRITPGMATLFKGSAFAGRDVNFDESITIPTTFTVAGLNTVSFSRLTATPSATGVISITDTTNTTRTITLNVKGMVE